MISLSLGLVYAVDSLLRLRPLLHLLHLLSQLWICTGNGFHGLVLVPLQVRVYRCLEVLSEDVRIR